VGEVSVEVITPQLHVLWRGAMQPFRATLTDDAGQVIGKIERSIQSPSETQRPRNGAFEFQETESFMQEVLEAKTFRLDVDDGSQLAIRVDSVSTSTRPGYSRVEFSCS
jgi:hypothetical protein